MKLVEVYNRSNIAKAILLQVRDYRMNDYMNNDMSSFTPVWHMWGMS